ncbi:MAG TPA: ornithine carbamoyltransferase [Syntrophales bacterium]|nr:ornithine carbamoyltransferase [Syntrophales bacterium]
MKRDLLTEFDLTIEEFDRIFARSGEMKADLRQGRPHRSLAGQVLGMIFEKSSTRTRLSFEVAMIQLGGTAIFLSSRDIQIGRGETVADTARILSRYVDGVMIRTFGQEVVEEFARYATIPVINGLTDLLHPCQILSDLFTVIEKRGGYEDLKIAYVGDGNNIANSWLNTAARLPFHLALACPEGYEPDRGILDRAVREAPRSAVLFRDPRDAVRDADVVYTDVWASMGQEGEKAVRAKAFQGYCIDEALLERAKPDVVVMHCLPAHRGEEISAAVMDGPRSIVFDQAENRLHVQKAILEMLMGR